MPSFTGSAVADEARMFLNNTSATVYTNAVLLPIINTVLDELLLELLRIDAPVTYEVATAVNLAANTATLSPAAVHARFVSPISIAERDDNSTGLYTPMMQTTYVPDRTAEPQLREWSWIGDTLRFVGASTARELLIRHTILLPSLANIGDSINLTGAKSFMSRKVAAIAAFSIGQNPSTASALNDMAEHEKGKLLNGIVKESQSIPIRRPGYRRPRRAVY